MEALDELRFDVLHGWISSSPENRESTFLLNVSKSISEHICDILEGKEVELKYTFEKVDKMA